jgi:DNA-binding PadR family transcriptional regulator
VRKDSLKRIIIRILLENETYGYEITKLLAQKGLKQKSNYIYTILAEMQESGLLKGRWVQGAHGPRKHLYSLSKKGEDEFAEMVHESMDLLMGAYIKLNLTTQKISDHARILLHMHSSMGIPAPTRESRLVLAEPYFNPLSCYPIMYYATSQAFPEASIYVVKPPEIKLHEVNPNLTFLDGWRNDLPLKDEFADYLFLTGFPAEVPEEETIRECVRVLKAGGHFLIGVSNVMTKERAPNPLPFADFVLKYVFRQDRTIRLERVEHSLYRYFNSIRDSNAYGTTYINATGKLSSISRRSAISVSAKH